MAVNRKGSISTRHNGGGLGIADKGGNVLPEPEHAQGMAAEKTIKRTAEDVEINAEIIALIQERIDIGAKKYGGGIKLYDGRNWLVEALEEILDCSVYLAAMIIKIKRGAEWENLIGKDY
jgi:hypothetical protein